METETKELLEPIDTSDLVEELQDRSDQSVVLLRVHDDKTEPHDMRTRIETAGQAAPILGMLLMSALRIGADVEWHENEAEG